MITQQELVDSLNYSQETGVFTRAKRTSNRINVGDIAGSPDSKGYLCIRVCGKTYKAHRLVWLYVHGLWPENEIDHINHDVADNRICNLRDVSKSVNQQNPKTIKGVQKDRSRFRSSIRVNGKRINLGSFISLELAKASYIQAKKILHVEARK